MLRGRLLADIGVIVTRVRRPSVHQHGHELILLRHLRAIRITRLKEIVEIERQGEFKTIVQFYSVNKLRIMFNTIYQTAQQYSDGRHLCIVS